MKKQLSTALHGLYRKALKHTKYRWVVILGTLLYLVSPLDISLDAFTIIGWLTGGLIVSLLVSEASQLMAEKIKHSRPADGAFKTEVETAFSDTFYPSVDGSADEYLGKTITVKAVQVG